MKRLISVIVLVAGTGACATGYSQQKSFSYQSSLGPDDAFTCVLRAVRDLDYSIEISDRGSGLIVGEKKELTETEQQALGVEGLNPRLNITILPAENGDGSELDIEGTNYVDTDVGTIRRSCEAGDGG